MSVNDAILDKIITEYLELMQSGNLPDRQQYLDQHPHFRRCKIINCRISGTAQAVRCCKTGGLAPACALALNLDPVVYLLTSPKFFSRNGFWGLPPVS